ncbi:LIM/homeobox protein Lhx2-like isoform X2 [Antennarius striatus]|uniref:LIM/homeobox protein Lhx2-like isoform X2 n=1 Tax=Antennarius striatus TaxID=241820 RepID=UPI0035B436EF
MPVRAAEPPVALLEGRKHLLPAGLQPVHHDFLLFGGGNCARCFQPIPSSALVMRSGELTFHPHCFYCQECDVKLIPGNLYCMQGPNLYCQSHYHGNESIPLSHDVHDVQPKACLKEDQNQVSEEGEESVSSPEPRLDDRVTGGRIRRRTKRIRTCFRSEQLRVLESCFARKHNPDGKDWTCLTHKTGLPKRVLQVWFQNARAKLRRSLTTEDSSFAPTRGVTVATSPPSSTCSLQDQSQPFPTSTIDQLELSLLTAPPDDPQTPAVSQLPSFFLDYDSQGAPGCASSLEGYEDFGEAGRGAEGDADPGCSFSPQYC